MKRFFSRPPRTRLIAIAIITLGAGAVMAASFLIKPPNLYREDNLLLLKGMPLAVVGWIDADTALVDRGVNKKLSSYSLSGRAVVSEIDLGKGIPGNKVTYYLDPYKPRLLWLTPHELEPSKHNFGVLRLEGDRVVTEREAAKCDSPFYAKFNWTKSGDVVAVSDYGAWQALNLNTGEFGPLKGLEHYDSAVGTCDGMVMNGDTWLQEYSIEQQREIRIFDLGGLLPVVDIRFMKRSHDGKKLAVITESRQTPSRVLTWLNNLLGRQSASRTSVRLFVVDLETRRVTKLGESEDLGVELIQNLDWVPGDHAICYRTDFGSHLQAVAK